MRLPKKIKIATIMYTIEERVLDCDEDFVGRCHTQKQLIEIEKNMGWERKVQVLIHELVHAMAAEFVIRLTDKNVDLFSTALIQLLKDNPKLKDLM